MSDYNPADIPATINFVKKLKPIQEEYKNAIRNGKHPTKENLNIDNLSFEYFEAACREIYENKVKELSLFIIKEHRESHFAYIDLKEYDRFQNLVLNAINNTREFLDEN